MRDGLVSCKFLSYLILILFVFHFLPFFLVSPSFSSPFYLSTALTFQFSTVALIGTTHLFRVASRVKVATHPKLVLSIGHPALRSAESFLNLAVLLSRLIHKFGLLGPTRFTAGFQKSPSYVHDCTWELWALQPSLLPSLLTKAISLIHGRDWEFEHQSNVMGLESVDARCVGGNEIGTSPQL